MEARLRAAEGSDSEGRSPEAKGGSKGPSPWVPVHAEVTEPDRWGGPDKAEE